MATVAKSGWDVIYGGMTFFEKLEKWMRKKNWTQKTLAEMSGVPEGRFSDWKKLRDDGKWGAGRGGPSMWQAVSIARALGVTAEFLADDDLIEPPALALTEDQRALLRVARSIGEDIAIQRLSLAPTPGNASKQDAVPVTPMKQINPPQRPDKTKGTG